MTTPTTVILDTQNIYGNSGDVLGRREKAVPSGVRDALAPFGFDVQRIVVAVARPDSWDERKALEEVHRQDRKLGVLEQGLLAASREILPGAVGRLLDSAIQQLGGAREALAESRSQAPVDLLAQCSDTCTTVVDLLRPASEAVLKAARSLASASAARNQQTVPAEWVAVVASLLDVGPRLTDSAEAVRRYGSYSYAAAANAEYIDHLKGSGDDQLEVREGRFRMGRDGEKPGEKQVDTLCAIECVEATLAALKRSTETGERRAVILVSDDDDLTPALRYCARLAHKTQVTVLVAGTVVLSQRYARQPASPDRPAWLCLDSSSWCRMVGVDPVDVLAEKRQLASLALGNPGVFDVSFETGRTGLGVVAATDAPDGRHVLRARTLKWGWQARRAVPGVVASRAGSAVPLAVPCRARRARGSGLSASRMPIDVAGRLVDAELGAPGWWTAGTELVAAEVQTPGGPVWRVLGEHPGQDQVTVEPRLATVVGTHESFVDVTDGVTTWGCFAPRELALAVDDTVVVWPYERGSGRTRGDGSHRILPRGVLLSSAL